MSKDKLSKKIKKAGQDIMSRAKKDMVKCHFISNTHWDREWRFSMQRTRHMLVYMLDMLLDIFQREPEFKSFHLDSQTIPLQDYLEIRPDRKELLNKLISEKKLLVGPWFCLPDEFSVGGESLIRNLLLGHKIARKFGHVSKTGYSPFSWGQISQMPQIYSGFGIDFASFYRGVNTEIAPRSEFIWQGADGTKVVASRLAKRPRYNVWYIIQRRAYWNMEDIDSRAIPWNCGNGPFKFIGDLYNDFDCQYTRPKFTYDKTVIAAAVKQAMAEQDDDWTTMHRFWSCGHDSSCPDVREIQMIKDCNDHLKGKAEVFHSTFEDFQEEIIKNAGDDLPVGVGEMRYYSDSESTSPLFGWIISARMDIKQDNFKTERDLIQYAEPLAVFAGLLGAEYLQGYLDQAYNWLLQNHGHDSIGGCSREIIGEDMLFRTRQSREIAGCVAERALLDITGAIDFDNYADEEVVLLVYNPAPFERDEVLTVNLDVPRNWQAQDVEILDENSRPVELEVLGSDKKHFQIVQSPNDTANMFETTLFRTKALIKNLPSLGYKVLRIRGLAKSTPKRINSMVCGSNAMENEFLRVQVNSNGTLKITDKIGNKVYDQMGYFRDAAEVGNPWQHEDVEERGLFTTLNENAQVSVVRDGKLESALRVAINFSLPQSRTADDRARSDKHKIVSIVNTVTLRKGQKWVEIVTDVNNTVEDHYLQVAFPSRIEADTVFAQGQFDVLERPVKLPFSENYREPPQSEQPMNSFIDITDGINGLAILNEGMKAYEATDQSAPELRLTLLRCFPLRICVTQEMTDYSNIDKGSQCLGSHRFRYAVMPHRGNCTDAGIWQAAEKFNLTPVVAQTAPTETGTEPLTKSFLKIEPDTLHLSAVKRSENGTGWIVRIFNPFDKTVDASVCLNGGFENISSVQSPVERLQNNMKLPSASQKQIWRAARLVSLEEIPEKDLKIETDGSCSIQVPPKKILTIEFLAG